MRNPPYATIHMTDGKSIIVIVISKFTQCPKSEDVGTNLFIGVSVDRPEVKSVPTSRSRSKGVRQADG